MKATTCEILRLLKEGKSVTSAIKQVTEKAVCIGDVYKVKDDPVVNKLAKAGKFSELCSHLALNAPEFQLEERTHLAMRRLAREMIYRLRK